KAYTNETFDKLIRYAAGVLPNSRRKLRLLALLLLAHDTGVRRGSLAIMQRQDFTFTEEGGWLLVWNTKRDRSYTSVFGAYTAGILQEWFERLPDDPAAYLWRNDASGAKLSAGAISKAIREACHAVDVEPLGVHGTRRKVGVDMADAGYSAFFISGILDDSVEVVLRHYMPRVSPEAIAAVKTRAYVPPTERKLVNIKDVG
ncbi:MAG: tyrosine-type recombinase/integrase, partial [Chloroflexota bacterium]